MIQKFEGQNVSVKWFVYNFILIIRTSNVFFSFCCFVALLFSATFRKRIEKLARDILSDPVRVVQGEVGEVWKIFLLSVHKCGQNIFIMIYMNNRQN